MYPRRVRIADPIVWPHHRYGWPQAITATVEQLHNKDGVTLLTSLDDYVVFRRKAETDVPWKKTPPEPWVGFVHQPPGTYWPNNTPPGTEAPSALEELIRRKMEFLPGNRGLFVLSDEQQRRLDPHFMVSRAWLPARLGAPKWSWEAFEEHEERKVVMLGNWLRRFQHLDRLQVPEWLTKRFVIGVPQTSRRLRALGCTTPCVRRLSPEEWDAMITRNIVFLSFRHVAASTTIGDCIGSWTPCLVNRLPATMDYLGASYPFFWDDLDQASSLVKDPGAIKAAHQYLREMDTDHLSVEAFVKRIATSRVYKQL